MARKATRELNMAYLAVIAIIAAISGVTSGLSDPPVEISPGEIAEALRNVKSQQIHTEQFSAFWRNFVASTIRKTVEKANESCASKLGEKCSEDLKAKIDDCITRKASGITKGFSVAYRRFSSPLLRELAKIKRELQNRHTPQKRLQRDVNLMMLTNRGSFAYKMNKAQSKFLIDVAFPTANSIPPIGAQCTDFIFS